MTRAPSLAAAGITLLMLLLTGCTTAPSRLQVDYGTSYHLAKLQQILNPGAEHNREPVYGLDGRAAQAAHEKYWKQFEKAQPLATYILPTGNVR